MDSMVNWESQIWLYFASKASGFTSDMNTLECKATLASMTVATEDERPHAPPHRRNTATSVWPNLPAPRGSGV